MLTPLELQAKRKSGGMTQKYAARLCGVHEGSYQRWESGARPIPAYVEKHMTVGQDRREPATNAPGFRPPLSAGFEDAKLVKAVRKVLPPFAPTAGPLVDPLDSVARCVGLIKMIRDALRDGGLQ